MLFANKNSQFYDDTVKLYIKICFIDVSEVIRIIDVFIFIGINADNLA